MSYYINIIKNEQTGEHILTEPIQSRKARCFRCLDIPGSTSGLYKLHMSRETYNKYAFRWKSHIGPDFKKYYLVSDDIEDFYNEDQKYCSKKQFSAKLAPAKPGLDFHFIQIMTYKSTGSYRLSSPLTDKEVRKIRNEKSEQFSSRLYKLYMKPDVYFEYSKRWMGSVRKKEINEFHKENQRTYHNSRSVFFAPPAPVNESANVPATLIAAKIL